MASAAPSDARTQGAPRGSATQATEDEAARSPVADGGNAAANVTASHARRRQRGALARGVGATPFPTTSSPLPAPAQQAEDLTATAIASLIFGYPIGRLA